MQHYRVAVPGPLTSQNKHRDHLGQGLWASPFLASTVWEEEGCAHMGFTSHRIGQGLLTQLGSPPPVQSPNSPSVMGFPTGHFLAVTSGTQISPCIPPFLAGTAPVGQAGSPHKGWHRLPFVHLRSVCTEFSACSRSGTGTRNEPQIIRRWQTAVLRMLTIFIASESVRDSHPC